MRIAHVIDSMEIGGAEMLVVSLCRQHVKQGHELTVHCVLQAGPLAEILVQEGVAVKIHGPMRWWRTAWSLHRALRASKPDLVHCHNVVASVLGAPAARLAGAKGVVCTRHGMVTKPWNYRRQGLFWLAARFADRVVAVCAGAQQNLAKAPFALPEKLMTIRNGAAPAPVSPAGAQAIVKQGYTAVTVARLAPPKDHSTLLRAVALAKRTVTDLSLWIIGDGPKTAELRQLSAQLGIGDRVQFLGERQDVGDWLALADLFVLSSESEGVPISLLEALAAGLPVLVTDVGGMPEIAALSGSGRVVAAGCPEDMATAIQSFAMERERRPEFARLARQCYSALFTPQQMSNAYMELYGACVTQH